MNKGKNGSGLSNKILWSLLTIAIGYLTIKAVLREAGNFSLESMIDILIRGKTFFLILAILGMMGFVFFEACSVRAILNHAMHGGRHTSMKSAIVYASADMYFSAITPSATGGQPASLYFMKKDGIPFHLCSSALLFNLMMYHVAIVFVGLVCMIVRPGIFFEFNLACKALIIVGYVVLTGLIVLFIMLLKERQILHGLGLRMISFLERIHVVKHPDRLTEKLDNVMREYEECSRMFLSDRTLIFKVFVYNVLQRVSQVAVPGFIYASITGSMKGFVYVFVVQMLSVIGSNCIPIPGAQGVIDYLMLNGFAPLMGASTSAMVEIASRGLTFYFCIIICLIIIVAGYYRSKKGNKQ